MQYAACVLVYTKHLQSACLFCRGGFHKTFQWMVTSHQIIPYFHVFEPMSATLSFWPVRLMVSFIYKLINQLNDDFIESSRDSHDKRAFNQVRLGDFDAILKSTSPLH